MNKKASSKLEISRSNLILIQSKQLAEAISVSKSSRPRNVGGRSFIFCGGRSKIPTGIYRYKNDNHSSMNLELIQNTINII